MSPRILTLCAILTLGPPAALIAVHHREWFGGGPPIDPHLADGQLLVFTADWCGACQRMKPVIADLSREGFDVRTFNVDRNREKAERYGIRSIPTFVLVRGGKEVRRMSGTTSAPTLRRMWQ
ncbi:MAG: thioredoxin family protein [Pirellulales bacterium]|nr:thioredoxin family protein [Pirellulales bacterium]